MENYLKWTATAVILIGALVNSFGFYPAGPILLLLASILWLVVSIMWNEKSLIVTNGSLALAGSLGLVYHYFIV